jgi:phosphatidylinositol phospholipase C gamma-1
LFLVRDSDTFPGEFALSFWHSGNVQHCRIRCKNGKYYMTDQISFANLYELIEYYRREAMKSANFAMVLGDAVPQPAAHEDKKWFHRGLSRNRAEEMLKRIKSDGLRARAFLC